MPIDLPTKRRRKRAGALPELVPSGLEMVTLTELPANRAPFKVVRSAHDAQEDPEMKPMKPASKTARRTRTAKRSDGLISILLPDGATEDMAQDVMERFGLVEDFHIEKAESGEVLLVRNDKNLDDYDNIGYMPLGKELRAVIDRDIFTAARADKETALKVVRLDFDGYDAASVQDWLKGNEIDFLQNGVEVVDGGVIVRRHEKGDQDSVKITIEEGVTAYVTRAEENDVPVKISRAVTDAAFGQFGMGHMDFSSAMVDPEFSMIADNAIMQLRDVLDNIMFYSQVELSERQKLYREATDQFVQFMDELISGLPTTVRSAAEAVVRSDALTKRLGNFQDSGDNQETADMINVNQGPKKKANRADSPDNNDTEGENVNNEVQGDAGDDAGEDTPVLRSELTTLVEQAVTAGVTAALAAQRSEEDSDSEDEGDDATSAEGPNLGGKLDALVASIGRSDETVKALAASVAATAKAVEKLEGMTVARSDDEDDEDVQPAPPRDAFDGMLGHLHGHRRF